MVDIGADGIIHHRPLLRVDEEYRIIGKSGERVVRAVENVDSVENVGTLREIIKAR